MASQWSIDHPLAVLQRAKSERRWFADGLSLDPWTGGHLAQRECAHGKDQDQRDRDSREDQGLPLDDEGLPLHACLYRPRTTVALAMPSPQDEGGCMAGSGLPPRRRTSRRCAR
jgi:hypothetical protein